jgi:hypothetical protein
VFYSFIKFVHATFSPNAEWLSFLCLASHKHSSLELDFHARWTDQGDFGQYGQPGTLAVKSPVAINCLAISYVVADFLKLPKHTFGKHYVRPEVVGYAFFHLAMLSYATKPHLKQHVFKADCHV